MAILSSGTGPSGKSPYQIVKEHGYIGTEDEFNEILAEVGDSIRVPGGGTATMGSTLGSGPYSIEIEEDEEGDLTAAQVGYNNTATGMTATNVQSAINELFTSVSEGKSLIAAAVTDKGVETAADATFQQMATNIGQIATGTQSVTVTVNAETTCFPSGNMYGIYYIDNQGTTQVAHIEHEGDSIEFQAAADSIIIAIATGDFSPSPDGDCSSLADLSFFVEQTGYITYPLLVHGDCIIYC